MRTQSKEPRTFAEYYAMHSYRFICPPPWWYLNGMAERGNFAPSFRMYKRLIFFENKRLRMGEQRLRAWKRWIRRSRSRVFKRTTNGPVFYVCLPTNFRYRSRGKFFRSILRHYKKSLRKNRAAVPEDIKRYQKVKKKEKRCAKIIKLSIKCARNDIQEVRVKQMRVTFGRCSLHQYPWARHIH